MGHHHHHHHAGADQSARNLLTAMCLNGVFSVIEIVGGLWTGSIAILSDAVHDLGDTLALGSAFTLEKLASKTSDKQYSYGYRRYSLMSALITSAFLVSASTWILIEAIPRLANPTQPKTGGMIGLALLGVVVNGYAAWRVHRGNTLNERVVSWHLMEDVLGWVAVLIAAIVMSFTDLPILDPLLSIVFTAVILWGVVRSLRSTVRLFLQGVPENIDVSSINEDIRKLPGVLGVHDTHMWSLDGESHVMTTHIVVRQETSLADIEGLKQTVRERISKHGKFHATIEVESDATACPAVDCVKG